MLATTQKAFFFFAILLLLLTTTAATATGDATTVVVAEEVVEVNHNKMKKAGGGISSNNGISSVVQPEDNQQQKEGAEGEEEEEAPVVQQHPAITVVEEIISSTSPTHMIITGAISKNKEDKKKNSINYSYGPGLPYSYPHIGMPPPQQLQYPSFSSSFSSSPAINSRMPWWYPYQQNYRNPGFYPYGSDPYSGSYAGGGGLAPRKVMYGERSDYGSYGGVKWQQKQIQTQKEHHRMEAFFHTFLSWLTASQKAELRRMQAMGADRAQLVRRVTVFFAQLPRGSERHQWAVRLLQRSCEQLAAMALPGGWPTVRRMKAQTMAKASSGGGWWPSPAVAFQRALEEAVAEQQQQNQQQRTMMMGSGEEEHDQQQKFQQMIRMQAHYRMYAALICRPVAQAQVEQNTNTVDEAAGSDEKMGEEVEDDRSYTFDLYQQQRRDETGYGSDYGEMTGLWEKEASDDGEDQQQQMKVGHHQRRSSSSWQRPWQWQLPHFWWRDQVSDY